jgi:hypothetical protein
MNYGVSKVPLSSVTYCIPNIYSIGPALINAFFMFLLLLCKMHADQ